MTEYPCGAALEEALTSLHGSAGEGKSHVYTYMRYVHIPTLHTHTHGPLGEPSPACMVSTTLHTGIYTTHMRNYMNTLNMYTYIHYTHILTRYKYAHSYIAYTNTLTYTTYNTCRSQIYIHTCKGRTMGPHPWDVPHQPVWFTGKAQSAGIGYRTLCPPQPHTHTHMSARAYSRTTMHTMLVTLSPQLQSETAIPCSSLNLGCVYPTTQIFCM